MNTQVCPRCGAAMQHDSHRRMDVMMCYLCGYVDDGSLAKKAERPVEHEKVNNFRHLAKLNPNEAAMFLAKGLKLDPYEVQEWLAGDYVE